MFFHVREAKYLHDYVIWVRFNDGASGEVDLRDELTGKSSHHCKTSLASSDFASIPNSKRLRGKTARTWRRSFCTRK
jgi:hypothetical protein